MGNIRGTNQFFEQQVFLQPVVIQPCAVAALPATAPNGAICPVTDDAANPVYVFLSGAWVPLPSSSSIVGAEWHTDEWSAVPGQVSFLLTYPVLVVGSFSFAVNGVEYDDPESFTRSGQTVTWLNSQFVMDAGDHVVARYLKG